MEYGVDAVAKKGSGYQIMDKQSSLYFLLGIVIFGIDRLSKCVALIWCTDKNYYVNSFLSGELAMNRGISWGLFHSNNKIIFLLVSLVIVCFTLLFFSYAYKHYKEGFSIVGEVCVITGSLCNIIDRVIYGGVIDFIILSYNGFSWPVFNFADVAIICGAAVMLIQGLRQER